MRLVFVTQQVDPESAVLGPTVAKIHALAERADEVVVIADGVVPGTLPANCRVHRFASRTRAGRGVRFLAALAVELLRRPRPAGVIAHMCPVYAVLAAPLARPLGVPVLLWFAQWHRSRMLQRAERVSTLIVTAAPGSVPLSSSKVTVIGHGIDVAAFGCEPPGGNDGLTVLALGRYAASKGLDTVVRAVAASVSRGVDVRLLVHGPDGTEDVRAGLERLASDLGVADRVRLAGPVPGTAVPALLASVDALVNATRSGAPDKVVYEAAAACRPALASSTVFAELLGGLSLPLTFAPGSAEELALRLEELAAAPPGTRHALGRSLRRRVERDHSVQSWADRVVELCRR